MGETQVSVPSTIKIDFSMAKLVIAKGSLLVFSPAVVVHTCISSTRKSEAGGIVKFILSYTLRLLSIKAKVNKKDV